MNRRRSLALIVGAVAVGLALWFALRGRDGADRASAPPPQGSVATSSQAHVAAAPSSVTQPVVRREVPVLRLSGSPGESGPPVLDADALFERDPVAGHYISRAIGGAHLVAGEVERCVELVRASIEGRTFVNFALQLHIVSVDGVATIQSATSDAWPDMFSDETRDCFARLYAGTEFDTTGDGEGGDYPPADDFDYVVVHPMGMNFTGRPSPE